MVGQVKSVRKLAAIRDCQRYSISCTFLSLMVEVHHLLFRAFCALKTPGTKQ